MLIKLEVLQKIMSGEIDLQFRRWKRRSVKAGGTLKTRVGMLQIGRIDPIKASDVSVEDAHRAGFADLAEFHEWLEGMKQGDLDRIEISYLGEDPLIAFSNDTKISKADLDNVTEKLARMDQRSAGPDWTLQILSLIRSHTGRLAQELASEMGLEKAPFKARVRKLKALGLTQSLEVGYQLSPRGNVIFEHIKSQQ